LPAVYRRRTPASFSKSLRGQGRPGATAAVVLNAAAAIYVARDTGSYEDAVEEASTALKAGKGITALDRLRAASNPASS